MKNQKLYKLNFTCLTLFFSFQILFSQEKWMGIGYQKNIDEAWEVELTIEDNKVYKVKYPDIPCDGIWIVRVKESNSVLLDEKIINGVENCIDNGSILLIKENENHMKFYVYYNLQSKQPYALGYLKKK